VKQRNQLISELLRDCKRVTVLPHPLWRFLRWVFISALCIGAGVAVIGVRRDFDAAIKDSNFLIQIFFILGLCLSSALGAFMLSVPSDRKPAWAKYFPIAPVLLWFGALFLDFGMGFSNHVSFHFGAKGGILCFGEILLLAFVPGAIIFAMLKKAAPIYQTWSGFLALVAAGSMAALGSQFTCSSYDPLHLFFWHYLPVIAIGWLGINLGKRFLKW